MSTQPAFPTGDQWKDVAFVLSWKDNRKKDIEERWRKKFPSLLLGMPLAVAPGKQLPPQGVELMQWENESLSHRLHRLETEDAGGGRKKKTGKCNDARSRHQVPALLAKDNDIWILSPVASRATPEKLRKAKVMYEHELEKKAQRELACGILGGEVICRSGHAFRVAYECGNRYCVTCGPRGATKLFARHSSRLLFVAQRLLLCGNEDCPECNEAIINKRVPHWPPAHGIRPKMVVAKLDFTLRNTGVTPGPEMMRTLNDYIKKFCRAIEKRFHISRKDYGLAYCDELGKNNTNAHAHGIYVGPWLPQEKKELSRLWAEITGGSFIISIKYARNFAAALYHAVKYPAKFAERSTPERLAELEVIFHRVRRFHTLAAFYAPETPEDEDADEHSVRRCPLCGEQLSEPKKWETLAELTRRGLPDLATAQRNADRAKALPP